MTESELIDALGFCACGCPEDAMEYARQGLQFIAGEKKESHVDRFNDEFKQWRKARRKEEQELFGSLGAAHFFYYWADANGLTNHRCSVPGRLSNKGREVLKALEDELEALRLAGSSADEH